MCMHALRTYLGRNSSLISNCNYASVFLGVGVLVDDNDIQDEYVCVCINILLGFDRSSLTL